jgi:hypothetical protein
VTVAVRIGTRFDDISVDHRRDYVRRELGERLHHIFRMADGRTLISCAGPGLCRECNRESRV